MQVFFILFCDARDVTARDVTARAPLKKPKDIGCATGSLIVFFFGESIGRKRMIMSGACTMLVGTVMRLLPGASCVAVVLKHVSLRRS